MFKFLKIVYFKKYQFSCFVQDWRVHVEQMHNHNDNINTQLKDTKGQLDKLYDDITRTLEKIGSREKYVNNQLEHHLQVDRLF